MRTVEGLQSRAVTNIGCGFKHNIVHFSRGSDVKYLLGER